MRAAAQDTSTPAMTLEVDETQAPRRIAFVHEEIRVRPGALALAYPRWIPGEHGPTGPIQQFVTLRVHSGNTTLPWTRDPEDIYTIHVEIPAGTDRITVDFDTLLENTISDHQLLLAWNTVVLYPRGIDKRQLMIEPSILLPAQLASGQFPPGYQSDGQPAAFCTRFARAFDRFPGSCRRIFSGCATGVNLAGGTRHYRGQPGSGR